MIALDTNLLVYAHWSLMPEHASARRAIERASLNRRGWGIPLPCISEFWAVVTHPACSKLSQPEEARAFLAALLEVGAKILYPREGLFDDLAKHACDLKIQGARFFDLQIAVTSLEAGAREMWSHDRNFVTVPGLSLTDPL